jgi:transcriptional regulator with GAF, ATPase, and Fis domain
VCAATHKDLRAEVTEGRFRGDLYFRIGRPEVRLPPLRERREEIPWLIERALSSPPMGGAKLAGGAEFVEACMLRPWPGNVRELLSEARISALSATAAHRTSLAATDLDDEAGRALELTGHDGGAHQTPGPAGEPSDESAKPEAPAPEPEAIVVALRAEQGNVARAAARLGVARSRVRRFIERQGIDVRALRSD